MNVWCVFSVGVWLSGVFLLFCLWCLVCWFFFFFPGFKSAFLLKVGCHILSLLSWKKCWKNRRNALHT